MAFKKFDEYMNDKGKIVEKPAVAQVADYTGPQPKSPEKGGDWVIKGGKTPKGTDKKPGDYHPTTKPWKPEAIKGGLGEKGKKAEPYPKNEAPKKEQKLVKMPPDAYPKGSKKGPWKSKTEEFIEKTSKMNLAEFTQHMLAECACEDAKDDDEMPTVTSYAAGKFHPHPPEAIKYVVHLASKNPRILDSLIHEIKRAGIMKDALASSMEHPEGPDAMVDILGDDEDGPRHSRSIARAMDDKHNKFMDDQDDMFESVGPPYGGYDDEEGSETPEDDSEEESPNDDMGDSHDDSMGHDDSHDDSEEPSDEHGGEEHSDEEGPPSPDDMPHDEPAADEEKPKRKLKKKFAHHHLIGAMGEYGHMRDAMKDHLGPQ